MLDEIKASPFTYNDETMISVKYGDSRTDKKSYHDGYVHGILSPSARLVYMTYEDGSRKHDIQEEILRDSQIMCFTSDKATMYRRIIRDIGNGKITVGYCGGHRGAENIAFFYGLEQSCRLNGIDYGNYIESALSESRVKLA